MKNPNPTKSNPKLKKWYRQFNKQYFKNRLPKNLVVRWTKDPRDLEYDGRFYPLGKWGLVLPNGHIKSLGPPSIVLQIALRKNEPYAHMVLLHEMCHAAVEFIDHDLRTSHGSRFQRWMKRLAAAGAMERWW